MIKWIIFDMDGVISDTQKLHSKVESALLARYGVQITPEEITQKYAGCRTRDFFEEILKKQNIECDLDKLLDEKRAKMEEMASISVDEVPWSVALIHRLHAQGYPLAVASASNLNYVTSVLKTLNITQYFTFIATGNMVSKGKPDPEIFLLAANKINIAPEHCLVIEDGRSGMTAAAAGNMKCIGLVTDKSKDYPTQNKVESLAEITDEYLKQII